MHESILPVTVPVAQPLGICNFISLDYSLTTVKHFHQLVTTITMITRNHWHISLNFPIKFHTLSKHYTIINFQPTLLEHTS